MDQETCMAIKRITDHLNELASAVSHLQILIAAHNTEIQALQDPPRDPSRVRS